MTWSSADHRRPHHDSTVWQLGKRLAVELYRVTTSFPDHERYGLIAQIRRSAVSIPSNVAEGSARDSDSDFLRFLYMARGSLEEIATQMEIAQELGYLDTVDVSDARETFEDLSPALQGLIQSIKTDIEHT